MKTSHPPIEALEHSQMFSAAVHSQAVPTPIVHSLHPLASVATEHKVLKTLRKSFANSKGTLKQPVSGGQILTIPMTLHFSYVSGGSDSTTKSRATKATADVDIFRLAVIQPTYVFDPFPTVYKFTLSTSNPFALFHIKRKDSAGDTMNFTGTLSKNFKTISGILSIQGPNRSLSNTYSVSASA